ncbi:MAG: polysaccharide biosynthesis protein [Bacteroidales bacterium]|jgi:UDP-N-acetylglucosamine 4,6-dehydratase|nr:polysaccharide biosynthesis protein [Bacteroidales bacterium]
MFKNKTILIDGGSGSWGNELTSQLLEKEPKKIIIFSRGELAQVNMNRKFNNKIIEFVIGDIRDYDAVDRLFQRGIDYVFHLAALKHVPVCENQPQEAIKTNINGTINLINSAIKYKVKKFIDVSTDKAVAPTNLYGMTKSVGEKLTIQGNNLTNETDFVCIRGGNVLGSNGSVVPFFVNQIKKNNEITITNCTMTRFFLTLSEAIKLLFQAVEFSIGGETYVMNMPSFYIIDLAKVLIDHYGDENTKIKEIGIREGEKIHEVLISEHESATSYKYNDEYYVILPTVKINKDYSHLDGLNPVEFKTFSSEDNLHTQEKLYEFLNKGGFLI